MAKIGVIGLGYVGLPLAQTFLDSDAVVYGFDIDATKITSIQNGVPYIKHFDFAKLQTAVEQRRFTPTSDFELLSVPDALIICVPTPLTENRTPDLSYVESTAEAISKRLRPGQLVVLESTTYPGTTSGVVKPILERSGLKLDTDYFLAFSPEREDPGNESFHTKNIPKVVGGMTPKSLKMASRVYQMAIEQVVEVDSCEIAEACKLLENTYRSVNIAMVNELKVLFDRLGIDIWKVIEAAKTKPFGFQPFYPGPGLGGHCIPIDPFYLSWLARKHELTARFIELAGDINTSMPEFVVGRVADALNDRTKSIRGSKVSIVGVAYKKDIDDPRESPSFKLMELLYQRGAILSYVDPMISKLPSMRSFNVPNVPKESLSEDYLKDQDCVLISTAHSTLDYRMIAKFADLIVDTRNAMSGQTCRPGQLYKA